MTCMNEVIARHRKLVEQYPQNEMARFSLGKALYDDAQFAAAREQFTVALERKPEWMAVQILLGKCDLQLGDRAAAKNAFERALQLAVAQNHERFETRPHPVAGKFKIADAVS